MKKLLSFLALFVVGLLAISMVSASDLNTSLNLEKVKINGNTVEDGENVYVEEGETLDVELKLVGLDDGDDNVDSKVEDIQVEVEINGYEYGDLEDSTNMFDLEEGDTRWVDLSIDLPNKLDKDLYLLRVKVTDKNSVELTETVSLKVNPVRHGLDIADVVFSPGTTVEAGHSLLTTVLVENFGGKDEEDVKVTLAIPELGVSVTDYIDEIDSGDKEHTGEDDEELYLRLPQCAEAGEYTATVTVRYDEGKEVSKDYQLTVLANEGCKTSEEKLVITVGPETQNVVANQPAAYPVALTNAGTTARTFVLDLTAGDWATSSLSENLVVLEPGKTAVVYAYLTADDAAIAGEKVATLTISSDNSVLKTLYLKANVVTQEKVSLDLRSSLEVALIVLVVVLVVIGLILGFSRLRKDEVEEDEEKTYY